MRPNGGLEVARIRLAMRGARNLAATDPLLVSFLHSSAGLPGHVEVPVRLELGGLPQTRGLPMIFDTGEGWRTYRDGRELVFDSPTPPDGERVLWVARLSETGSVVSIHPDPELLAAFEQGGDACNLLHYPLDQLLMIHLLPQHRGLLLHAAGVCRGARAVVFPGRSGAGKSTLMRLMGGRENPEALSDDRMVVRFIGSEILAFGTPWAGTERIAANESAGLAALAFLHQDSENRLRALEQREALDQLLPIASILWHDETRATQSLALCSQLLERVPSYDLHFRDDESVRETIEELL